MIPWFEAPVEFVAEIEIVASLAGLDPPNAVPATVNSCPSM